MELNLSKATDKIGQALQIEGDSAITLILKI